MSTLTARWRAAGGLALTAALVSAACSNTLLPTIPTTTLEDWPHIQSAVPRDDKLEADVSALLAKMSLEEKVGQMTQVEIQGVTPEEIKQYHIGSVLNGGGSYPGQNKAAAVTDWLAMADALWTASVDPSNANPIPLIWGTDAVHGHNNVKGATLFPHNIGLGATRDPTLLRRIGEVTAREVARTGIDWVFGPTLAVVRDDRWGRTYEGYSEDPLVVQSYAGEVIRGLQGGLAKDVKPNEKVVATAKHFLGDGGTTDGKDQGVTFVSEADLINIHGRGYYTALQAGAQTVMASFSSWKDQAQGDGARATKMHGNKYLLTDVLKTKMGFDGFVVSDWNGMGQVNKANSDSGVDCVNSNCPQAINAGIDLMMVPYHDDWKAFIANTIASVKSGEIPQARIDDAVRRILRVKMRAGLFTKVKPSARLASRDVGTAEHRAVAREAVRKSLVLLKNNGAVLPLSRSAKILVAGKSADSLVNQSGGWSLSWQGADNTNADFGGGTTLWQAIQKIAPGAELDTSATGAKGSDAYDAAIVVIGETPYAEGVGDIGKNKTLEHAKLHPEDLALIDALRARGVKKLVTVMMSGRPLYTSKELNRSDAFVAAWLPGTEGDGLADVLFKKDDGSVNNDFSGKLSYSWPKAACQVSLNKGDASYDPLYAFGYGLTYANKVADQAQYDETSATQGCGAIGGGGGTTSEELLLFQNGASQGQWAMRVGAPSSWSVLVSLATASSTEPPQKEITATPVDDKDGKQWAAVKARWNGAPGQLYIQSANENDKVDLQSYLNSEGAVVFDARVSTAPSDAVKMRVDCGYPCIGEIDVSTSIKGLPLNTWTELAVPLKCFADKGTDFTGVNTPLLLYSSGQLELSVANIRWVPHKAGNVDCSGGTATNTVQITSDKNAYVNGVSDPALLAAPGSWSYGSGSVTLNADFADAGGKVIDVVFNNVTDGGGNGGVFFTTRDNVLFDVSSIAATGGVTYELRVLDYGNSTQDFWVKLVCNRKSDSCRTGDLKTLVGRPALNAWTTMKIPFTGAGYADNGFDATKLSSLLELLPAWDDQKGNIHFQLRNVRIVKTLP